MWWDGGHSSWNGVFAGFGCVGWCDGLQIRLKQNMVEAHVRISYRSNTIQNKISYHLWVGNWNKETYIIKLIRRLHSHPVMSDVCYVIVIWNHFHAATLPWDLWEQQRQMFSQQCQTSNTCKHLQQGETVSAWCSYCSNKAQLFATSSYFLWISMEHRLSIISCQSPPICYYLFTSTSSESNGKILNIYFDNFTKSWGWLLRPTCTGYTTQ